MKANPLMYLMGVPFLQLIFSSQKLLRKLTLYMDIFLRFTNVDLAQLIYSHAYVLQCKISRLNITTQTNVIMLVIYTVMYTQQYLCYSNLLHSAGRGFSENR